MQHDYEMWDKSNKQNIMVDVLSSSSSLELYNLNLTVVILPKELMVKIQDDRNRIPIYRPW